MRMQGPVRPKDNNDLKWLYNFTISIENISFATRVSQAINI